MSLPKNIKEPLLAQFDNLISKGETLVAGFFTADPNRYDDLRPFSKWKASCVMLLNLFANQSTTLREQKEEFDHLKANDKSGLQFCLGILEAFRENFDKGFFDDLLLRVEAEVAADYMGQAQGLLKEGQSGNYDHVPAAVLAGAVLEKALRRLCDQHQPPVPTLKANGDPKTLNPLIDDLKKVGVFNELKAKQLRSWADIRNAAAHGDFTAFKKDDVEQMIPGINTFLADYLK